MNAKVDNVIVESNWNFNSAFPSLKEHQVQRPQVIETIKEVLTSDSPVVFLEGESGIGATTTLAQFTQANDSCTFSIFLNPASRYSYSLEYVKVKLAEQFKVYLDGVPFDKSAIDDGEYASLIHRVRAKFKHSPAYFVVDGLAHIPAEDEIDVCAILTKALPTGVDGFRFLVSGPQVRLACHLNKVSSKPYQLMRFTPAEVDDLYSDFELEHGQLEELKSICKGNPGRLCSIRRLLKSGKSLNDILGIAPEKYLDFIALEFAVLKNLTQEQLRATAVLAYSKQPISKSDIASIAKVSENLVDEILDVCVFLDQHEAGKVDFLSNSHRKYAEAQLKSFQREVNDLQIEYLSKKPDSDTALLFLPSYLEQSKKYLELIELISNEHYYNLLDSTQSLTQLRQRAELGLVSAHALKNTTSVFQFCLQKSLFIDLSESSSSKAEVEALISIGQNRHAMHLVERAVTKISKLSMLAAYSSGLKKRSKNVEPFIVDAIRDLVAEVDFSEAGSSAWQISEDLISIDPDLAAEALEKSLSNTDDRQKDLVYSRLSLVASMGSKAVEGNSFEGKIKAKAIQEFTSALTQFQKNKNSDQIIEFISKANVKNRISLLTSFVAMQQKRDGLLSLISYALDVIVKDSTYIPKAKDYADLAAPLRYQESDHDTLRSLIGRFDGQIGLVRGSSVTRDWVRLNISLAYAECKFAPEAAYGRLLDSYYDVSQLTNTEIQVECYARLFYALNYIDHNDYYENKEGLKSVIDVEIKRVLNQLTEHAASQHACVESVLPAIVEYDPVEAVAIASRLNTAVNRDHAYQQILELLVRKKSSESLCKLFRSVLPLFTNAYMLEDTIENCTAILTRIEFDLGWVDELKIASFRIEGIAQSTVCKINLYKCISESGTQPPDASDVLANVNKLIETINPTAIRNDICFKAVEALSEHFPESAEKIYNKTIEVRETLEFENPGVQQNFLQCLALVVRSFGAAFKNNLVNEQMLSRLSNAIGRILSEKHQISLYTDLASRAWIAGGNAKKIVDEYCRPLLESTRRKDNQTYKHLLEISFPALFTAHNSSALKMLVDLDSVGKHAAIINTCELIRRKLTKNDPDASDDSEIYPLDFEHAWDICLLMEHVNYDAALYQILEKLCRTVASRKNKSKITVLQRRELSDKIIDIASAKFPDESNILHDGYLICATAKAYTLVDEKSSAWEDLISRANNIPNVADKAYVLIEILKCLPKKYTSIQKTLVEQAENASEIIPSLKDKLGRFELFSLACKDLNLNAAKNILKKSLTMSLQLENMEDAAEIQKSLIDVADQIEPGYADILLELFDDDPARAFAKQHAKHSVEVLKAKKSLADCNNTSGADLVSEEYLSEAAWKNLSALLSHRITTKPLLTMTSYMSASSSLGLGEVYPLFCWYIENASKKYIFIEDSKAQILPLCESLLTSTELALSVVSRKNDFSIANFEPLVSAPGMLIKPNDRKEAFLFIQNWLNQNCVEYIKVCDPYFTKDDIDIVQAILAANPDCRVHILASAAHLSSEDSSSNESFERAWHKISEQTPPDTYIYGIGKHDGKELIHDRWILSKNSGLRIGTSLNSIGYKYSEISVMSDSERLACEAEIDRFLSDQVSIKGVRVKMTRYQL